MSSRPRIPLLIGAACTALLLAGCSSSGTISGGGSAGGTLGGLTGGASGDSGGSSGTTGGTGGTDAGTDAGCTSAMLAIQNAEKNQNATNPQTALQALSTSIGQLRAAANTTKKPGGKDAMNRVAADLQTILTNAQSGQTPDTQQAFTDAQLVADICGV